jgi:hypothetical protein
MKREKRLITKVLTTFLLASFAAFTSHFAAAQDSTRQDGHRFTHLKLEVRGQFDIDHHFGVTGQPATWDTTDYGFRGKYFNLILGGEFGKGFSYYFRQRIIATAGAASLFDNTDFLYLQYRINDHWALRAGKEAIANGGFEYDAAPIDVLYFTQYWGNVYCFQLAGSVIYTDRSRNHKLTLQVSNSPYVKFVGSGNEWSQGLLGFSVMWSGNFPHFKTLYSVNFFERARGKFVNHVTLGNKVEVGRWNWYIDYQNRLVNLNRPFDCFFIATRMAYSFRDVNLFLKAGYDQNLADSPFVLPLRDVMMDPGQRCLFYGGGVEYRPHSAPSVRLHACLYMSHYLPAYQGLLEEKVLHAQIGLTWNVDFLHYFQQKKEF